MIIVIRLLLLALLTALPIAAQDIVGDWIGTLHAGTSDYRIVVHIARKADGALQANLDSLDLDAMGIPISSIQLKESRLSFTSSAIHGSYEGTVNTGRTAIEGTFSQGVPLPLNFKRVGT